MKPVHILYQISSQLKRTSIVIAVSIMFNIGRFFSDPDQWSIMWPQEQSPGVYKKNKLVS